MCLFQHLYSFLKLINLRLEKDKHIIKEEVDDLRAQNEQINKMKVKPKFLISCKGDY